MPQHKKRAQMTALFILQGGAGGGIASFAPMLIVLVIIYFFFIRPQSKKQKEQNEFMTQLAKGQEVVTSSGIIGRISKVDDKEVTLQIDQKSFVRVTKGAVSREMTEAFSAVEEKK